MGTTSFASVNYMNDNYAERLYNRLMDNHDHYVENNPSTTITNKWELISAESLSEFYNTNTIIQNFISENVNSSSFGNVFYINTNGSELYIIYCDDNTNPTITWSYWFWQFNFQNCPTIQINFNSNGELKLATNPSVKSTTFSAVDSTNNYYYHSNYSNKDELLADLIIEDDTITKIGNFIPFVFNGEDIEFPFTNIKYENNYYRLAQALENGYIEPSKPIYNNGQITGTLTPSGDNYIINAQVSGDIDYGQGNAELGSGEFENLKTEAEQIIGTIVPSNNVIGMFYQIISGFNETLIGTGEETIEFDHQGKHYIISSSQITLPISEIKAFTGLFFDVAIIIAIGLSISYIIRKMEEGDVISVLSLSDADMYFYYNDLNMF